MTNLIDEKRLEELKQVSDVREAVWAELLYSYSFALSVVRAAQVFIVHMGEQEEQDLKRALAPFSVTEGEK